MPVFTKTGAEVFNPVDGSGNPRGPVMGEMQTWATEVEGALTELGHINGSPRIITAAGDVTILIDDGRVHVKKTVPAATNVIFPSYATWVAANGYVPFTVKNRTANPALYPLTPVLDGSDTLEETTSVLPQDTREEIAYWPDYDVAGNWEIHRS